MEDEDEEAFFCDDCGDEFATQSALDGHESEGCWAAEEEGDED